MKKFFLLALCFSLVSLAQGGSERRLFSLQGNDRNISKEVEFARRFFSEKAGQLNRFGYIHKKGQKNTKKLYSRVKKKIVEDDIKERELKTFLYIINERMRRMSSQISRVTDQVLRAHLYAKDLARKIVDMEERVKLQQKKMSKRLRLIYKLDNRFLVRILFSSTNSHELNRNLLFLNKISQKDSELIKSLKINITSLKTSRSQLKDKVKRLMNLRSQLKAQNQELESDQRHKIRFISQLRKERAMKFVKMRKLRDRLGNPNLIGESHLSLSFFEKKGRLIHPVKGELSDSYGVASDPKYRYLLTHKGHFYEAPKGSPVYGIYSGKVAYFGVIDGYGKTVIIDHGDHYYTVYSGHKSVSVFEGQEVAEGTVLGFVGFSRRHEKMGAYFEIRHFSDAVDSSSVVGGKGTKNLVGADMKKKYIIIISGIILSIALVSIDLGAKSKERYLTLQLFAKVLNLVQEYYVEDVDTKKLIYGGVRGMLKELDPHTNFLPPNIYKEFETETSGEFGGLGIEITIKKGVLTIISPIEDTPAWRAGLKSGDKIVLINGESTKGFSLVDAAQRMRGKKGHVIKLGVFREGFDKPKIYSIKRGTVKVKSAKYTDLEKGYAYVKLTSFTENTAKGLKKILKKHIKKYKKIRGLIIDMRKNPGGLLDQAVEVSDMFVSSGMLVSTRGRGNVKKEIWHAKKQGTYEGFPIIVLIDEYSASASEIVAGALKDNKRALIMGQKSFGKGSVQSIVKLGDGSGLKLTVARYYTPNGASIQAEGITPDVRVEDIDIKVLQEATDRSKRAKREKDIVGHLQGDKKNNKASMDFWWDESYTEKKELSAKDKLLRGDFQVLQAYNYLRAWKVMRGFGKTKPLSSGAR